MFFAFNWAYENRGASGFVDVGSSQDKSDSTTNTPLKPYSLASLGGPLAPNPNPYRDVAVGPDRHTPMQRDSYHDADTPTDMTSALPSSSRNAAAETRTRTRPKGRNAKRPMSPQTVASESSRAQPDDRSRNTFPYDADRRVKAFEDRVIGLDEQVSLIQKMVNDTLNGQRILEQEVKVANDAAQQLRNSREEWQEKSTSLDSQLNKARAENSLLDSQLAQAMADYSAVNAQLKKAREDIGTLEDSLNKTRANYALLNNDLTQSRVDNSTIDGQLNRAQSDISKLETQLSKVQTEYSTLERQLDSVRLDNTTLNTQLTQSLADKSVLDGQILKLRADWESAENQLTKARADQSKLDSQLIKARADHAVLDGELNGVRAENTMLGNQLKNARSDYEEVNSRLSNEKSVNSDLGNQLTQVRGDCSVLDGQLANARADITALDKELNQARAEASKILSDHQQENRLLEERFRTEWESKTLDLQGQLSETQKRIQELTEELSRAEFQGNLNMKISQYQEELQKESSKIQEVLDLYIKDRGALQDEYHQLMSKSMELQDKLGHAVDEARTEIRSYLDKTTAHNDDVKSRASVHLEELKDALKSNLELWNEHINQKAALGDLLEKERERIQKLHEEKQEHLLKDHQEEKKILESRYESLKENFQQEKDKIQNERRALETQLSRLRAENETTMNERNKLNQEKHSLEGQLERIKEDTFRESERLHSELRILEERLNRLQETSQEERNRLQEEKRLAESKCESINEQAQKQKIMLQDEKRKLEDEIRRFTLEKEVGEREAKRLQEEQDALKKRYDRLEVEKIHAQQESTRVYKALEDRYGRMQSEKENMGREMEGLRDEKRLIQDEFSNFKREHGVTKAEIQQLEDKYSRAQSEKESIGRELEGLRGENRTIQDEFSNFRKEHGITRAEVQQLEDRYSRVQSEKESISRDMEELRDEKKAIQDEFKDFKKEHGVTKAEIRKLEDECSAKTQELQKRQARVDEITTQLEKVQTQLSTTKEQLDSREVDIINFKTEIGRLQAEIQSFEAVIKANERAKDEAIQVRSTELIMNLEEEKQELRKEQQRTRVLEGTVTELQKVKESQDGELVELRRKLDLAIRGANDKLSSIDSDLRMKDAEVAEWVLKFQKLEKEAQNEAQMRSSAERKEKEAALAVEKISEKLSVEESRRRVLFEQVQAFRGNIRVMCRIRPTLDGDGKLLSFTTKPGEYHNNPASLEIIRKRETISGRVATENHPYDFERVFTPEESNEAVFYEISQLVQSFIDGKSVCIFCYGQTGTGKTYTMSNEEHAGEYEEGVHHETDGIIPRTKSLAFREARRLLSLGNSLEMKGCCYEIYLDKLYLLTRAGATRASGEKTIVRDGDDWYVKDPELLTLDTPADFDHMYNQAMSARRFRPTAMNDQSSRSHFIVRLEFHNRRPHSAGATHGVLNLVDLAGSERRKTSGTEGAGLQEGIAINESLSVLKSVLLKLKEGGKPSEYREKGGTLARLLQPSLGSSAEGNNCMTLMFVMINLRESDFEVTKNSLEYAMTAQKVTTQGKSSMPPPPLPSSASAGGRRRIPAPPPLPGTTSRSQSRADMPPTPR